MSHSTAAKTAQPVATQASAPILSVVGNTFHPAATEEECVARLIRFLVDCEELNAH